MGNVLNGSCDVTYATSLYKKQMQFGNQTQSAQWSKDSVRSAMQLQCMNCTSSGRLRLLLQLQLVQSNSIAITITRKWQNL